MTEEEVDFTMRFVALMCGIMILSIIVMCIIEIQSGHHHPPRIEYEISRRKEAFMKYGTICMPFIALGVFAIIRGKNNLVSS